MPRSEGVAIEAYSPLTKGMRLEDHLASAESRATSGGRRPRC